jgi:hypothetical protein
MGAWSGATDNWDAGLDTELATYGAPGYAGVYHQKYENGWLGGTAFYFNDIRAPLAPDESKTWDSIYVWADPIYTGDVMPFSMEADDTYPPPADRTYLLELLIVPDGVVGAPAVGTVWELPLNQVFTLLLPTWWSDTGLDSYRFAFTITAAPEPAGLAGLVVVMLFSRRASRCARPSPTR